MIDTIVLYNLDTSLIDFDLNSRSQECEKANTSAPAISPSFQSIGIEFGMLLILVGVMNLILILSCPFNIQGREPNLYDFVKKKNFNVGLYSDIYRLISFKLCMLIKTTKLYILI